MIANLWIAINAVFYLGFGLLTLVNPDFVADAIGYTLTRPVSYAELKACYGGLMSTLGIMMFYLLYKDQSANALIFIGLIYLGFGTGRTIGILTNQAYDRTTFLYLTIECISVIISYVLLRFNKGF